MIKLLACIFMFIDHVGLIFFPQYIVLRIIGRLSMPLYAYCIARGIKYTKDIKRYFKRVLKVAIIAEIPFCIMVKELKLNICFLWLMGICYITISNKLQQTYKKMFLLIIAIMLVYFLNIDYGVYGFIYFLIMYFVILTEKKNNDLFMYVSWVILHIFKIIFSSGIMQVFTLVTIPVVDICNRYGFENKKINNIFIYYFYPIHMIILLLIYEIMK